MQFRERWGPSLKVRDVNAILGKVEYLFGHLRDYTLGVIMTAGAVFNLTMCLLVKPENVSGYFYDAFYFGVFALLSLYTYRRHVNTGIKMTEFMRTNPWIHPQEFFDHYYRRLGPLNEPIPPVAERTVNPEDVSYCTGSAAEIGYSRLVYGFYDTAIFARSAYKALQELGPIYGNEVFDVMASLWGSRMIQLFRSRMKTVGTEKFRDVEGKVILVFNHKSHLDFVLNFFALSKVRLKDGRPLRPRYMAAKDHFVDNKLVYEGIGVGRLIESVDMVFVDRKGKGVDAIQQAAEVVTNKDVSIAMYPQGTRAYGNLGTHRERRDAGYYTSGSVTSLKQDLGHLKKGCAFLALDTAIELRRQRRNDPVNLVFIGIDGTADLVPKGGIKVRTESDVTFTVGDIVRILPSEVDGYSKPGSNGAITEGEKKYQRHIDELMRTINQGLVKALNLHHKLIDRFISDVREENLASAESWLAIKNRLITWDHKGHLLPFQIIDRIYALDPSYWKCYQETAAKLFATELDPGDKLQKFNEDVVDYLFKTRGKLMKRATMTEKKREGKWKKAS
jgi:1-acyl-sn-glycerol-3-phosphate acyltransferase